MKQFILHFERKMHNPNERTLKATYEGKNNYQAVREFLKNSKDFYAICDDYKKTVTVQAVLTEHSELDLNVRVKQETGIYSRFTELYPARARFFNTEDAYENRINSFLRRYDFDSVIKAAQDAIDEDWTAWHFFDFALKYGIANQLITEQKAKNLRKQTLEPLGIK